MIQIARSLYGHPITARVTLLPRDIHVLLTGGQLPHVGASSLFWKGEAEGAIQPAGHREQALTDRWAEALSRRFGCRAAVVGGIHYDNASPEQIAEIVSITEEMLEEASRCIQEIKKEEQQDEQRT